MCGIIHVFSLKRVFKLKILKNKALVSSSKCDKTVYLKVHLTESNWRITWQSINNWVSLLEKTQSAEPPQLLSGKWHSTSAIKTQRERVYSSSSDFKVKIQRFFEESLSFRHDQNQLENAEVRRRKKRKTYEILTFHVKTSRNDNYFLFCSRHPLEFLLGPIPTHQRRK